MRDTIKREDAITLIDKPICPTGNSDYDYGRETEREAIKESLMALPSAGRPQGEWIRDRYWSRGVGMGEEYGSVYKCSLCECEVENGYTRCGFNFCPYCGADMRKGVDDENHNDER